ncbi:hypothetical protein [Kordiimonas marina]|uniref:hypothetical protein n=1 Tax=Kordiimonas marina TaxID=2872312 RepID=UPI001FF2AB1F|nr:hypothetical protein [Kordiimonas marina]MCJ9427595.1 hypothetical protein [Kordiimonas marina]
MSGESAPVPPGQSAFGERYVVMTASPLPEFSTAGGEAFKVNDQQEPGRELYALVHNPLVPLRNDVYRSIKGRPIPNMVNPVDRGLMSIDKNGRKQRLVTIFERPVGGPLMGPDGKVNPRVNTNRLRQHVVLSVLKALAALHKRGIFHRNLKPSNMYFATKDGDEVWIGECYSTPPGFRQPFALEALDLALADDTARGAGSMDSDFYQFGVALQCLYFGEQLWQGRKRDAMVMARINQGSYWALSGGRDIPGALGSLIKGMMADEPDERWGAEDVLDWFDGVGKPKRTSLKAWTMNRPTNFKGVAYVDRRLLADAFAREPREAASFLKKLDFPSWAQLSFRDEILTERLEAVIDVRPAEGFSGARADDYKMVSRVCMFLHPTGPVHFRGHSMFLDGMGSMIADAFARDDRDLLAVITDMMDQKFMSALTEICGPRDPGFAQRLQDFKRLFHHGTSKSLGRGMERVLYEMNPILPCISPRFDNVWIGSIKQLMNALDRLSASGGGRNILLDRHVAAYCNTHGPDLSRDFNKLAAAQNDPGRFASLSAEFFGLLQRRFKMGALPHLTEKLVDSLGPVVKGLKNKKRRETVQQQLDKIKKGGDITRLTSDVNMLQVQAEDAREFGQARNLIHRIERERARLNRKILPTDPEARLKGIKGSRTLAFVVMVLVGFLTMFPG